MRADADLAIHPWTFAALAATLVLFMLAFAPSADGAEKPVKGPDGAKFYTPPKDYPKAHGELIWQRKAGNLMPIDGARSNTLVLYSSKTPQGKRSAVSGSVSVPRGKPPKKGWPVISYAHGTTGTAELCAPTRVTSASPVAGYVNYIDPVLEDWIAAGYAVVRSDFQGLGTPGPHAYLVGEAEGRGVVDIVEAARDLNPDIGKRYLIAGHSQGGHAALFAAGLADDWAPGLKLRGTVAYAPASHLAEQVDSLPALKQPSPLSALAALILEGAATVSDEIVIPQLLNPEPLALYPQVKETCLAQLSEPDSLGGVAPADLLQDDANLSELINVLDAQNPAVKTKAPILIAQGTADSTVFKFFTDLLDEELVALGDDVDYRVYEGVGHGEIPLVAEPDALAFFEQRLPPGR